MLNPSGIVLKLIREDSNIPADRRRRAGFWVMANPRSKVVDFYRNGQNDKYHLVKDAEHVPMEKLTEDKVKESALTLVKALIHDT